MSDRPHCRFHAEGYPATYVLDALDGGDERAFGAHLPDCPLCRDDVTALRVTAAHLPLALDAPPPPPALRERLLAAIAAEQAPRPAPHRCCRPRPLCRCSRRMRVR